MVKIQQVQSHSPSTNAMSHIHNADKIADLARIHLTKKEKESLTGHLEKILGYIDQLNELDVDGVTPTSHPLPLQNVFRDDTVLPSLNREKLLKTSPASKNGMFQVPKIID